MAVRRISSPLGLRYIYVIECEGRHKVGISAEPGARLPNLQTGNPFPLRLVEVFPLPGKAALKMEAQIHRALAQHSAGGEWFNAPFDVIRAEVVKAFDRAGIMLMSLDTLAHKLSVEYVKSFAGASPIRLAVAKARVGNLIDPALSGS